MPGQFKVTTNTSQPSYQLIFSEIGISRCKSTEIMFSVYGHNSVGNGEFSNITFTLPHGDQMCGSIETTSTGEYSILKMSWCKLTCTFVYYYSSYMVYYLVKHGSS